MIRKSLFWGLTLVLVVALINLIIRGRRLEKHQAGQVVEDEESRPTPTRVLAPQDLEIVKSIMRLEAEAGGTRTAWHEIEIRNTGKVPYGRIQLIFDYLDRSGKVLASRTRSIVQTVSPGTTLKFGDIRAGGLPASTADFRAVIMHADMGHEAGKR